MGSNESKLTTLLWPIGFSLAVGAGVWWFLHSRLQANERPDAVSDSIDDTRNPDPARRHSLTEGSVCLHNRFEVVFKVVVIHVILLVVCVVYI